MSDKGNLFNHPNELLDNSPLTTDLPVVSAEPFAKQQDPVMSVPRVEKQPDVPKNAFKRQLVLIASINETQLFCERVHGHFLSMPHKDMISCYNCGALWIK